MFEKALKIWIWSHALNRSATTAGSDTFILRLKFSTKIWPLKFYNWYFAAKMLGLILKCYSSNPAWTRTRLVQLNRTKLNFFNMTTVPNWCVKLLFSVCHLHSDIYVPAAAEKKTFKKTQIQRFHWVRTWKTLVKDYIHTQSSIFLLLTRIYF